LFSSDNIDRIDKIEDEINKTPYHYGKWEINTKFLSKNVQM
jgi:hypothetical protein